MKWDSTVIVRSLLIASVLTVGVVIAEAVCFLGAIRSLFTANGISTSSPWEIIFDPSVLGSTLKLLYPFNFPLVLIMVLLGEWLLPELIEIWLGHLLELPGWFKQGFAGVFNRLNRLTLKINPPAAPLRPLQRNNPPAEHERPEKAK